MKTLKRLSTIALIAPIAAALFLSAPLVGQASAAPKKRTAKKAAPPINGLSGVVNINTAGPDHLRLLPGIGPAKAQRIVAYRTRRQFKQTYEIIRVRGIGRRTYRHLRRYLSIKGATTLTGAKTKSKRPRHAQN